MVLFKYLQGLQAYPVIMENTIKVLFSFSIILLYFISEAGAWQCRRPEIRHPAKPNIRLLQR